MINFAGTHGFMAPEAYRNRQDVGPHSDIFALAVTLYYLVSRRMPFHADDDYGWIFAVAGNMEEQAQRLSDVCPDVSAGFSDIIAKGLQKKIPQRYGNAAEMTRDLEEHRKSRAQDLLQVVEKRREELEIQQAKHAKAVCEQQQRIDKEQKELATLAQCRKAQFQREQEELERKERELAGQSKLNRDEQKKVHDERQRLEAERTKILEERRRCEKDLQKKQQKLDQRKSEEEAQLKSEKKEIGDRKMELEKKEREASKGLQVPPYWKNKSGINFVATVANVSVEEGHSQEILRSTACSFSITHHQLATCDAKQGCTEHGHQ